MWRELFLTVVQLIVAPSEAWKELKKEGQNHADFLNRFLYPLFGIIALTTFIGGLWFTRKGGVEVALKNSIVAVVTVFGTFYIVSYILNEMAGRFDMSKDLLLFQRFTGYASVVIFVLFCLTPFLSGLFIIWLPAFYTIHLVHMGSINFLKIPSQKRGTFIIVASALVILMPAAIHTLFSFFIQ